MNFHLKKGLGVISLVMGMLIPQILRADLRGQNSVSAGTLVKDEQDRAPREPQQNPQPFPVGTPPSGVNNIIPNFPQNLSIAGDLTVNGNLRLPELPVNGSDVLILRAADAMPASYTLRFPPTDGINSQVLATNGTGQLAWQAAGGPAVPAHVLRVTTGVISGPNQFNSVKAAIDSITDSSPTNPYVVEVGPGLFIEDTITMKSYVSLIGYSPDASIIHVDNPAKDVIIAVDQSFIAKVTLTGATGSGSAGIRLTAGYCEIEEVAFEDCDICLYEDAIDGDTKVLFESCSMESDAIFTTGVFVDGSNGHSAYIKIDGLTWLQKSNTSFNSFIHVTGAQAVCYAHGVDAGKNELFGGVGCDISDGALFGLNSSSLQGFATGILVENLGAAPVLNIMSVSGAYNTNDINIAHPGAIGTVNGVFAQNRVLIDPAAQISLFLTDSAEAGTVTIGSQYVGDTLSVVTDISELIEQGSNLGVIYGGDLTAGAGLSVDVSGGSGYLMLGLYPDDNLFYVVWDSQNIGLTPNADNFVWVESSGNINAGTSAPDPTTTILIGKARTDSSEVVFVEHIHKDCTHAASQLDESWRGALGPIYGTGSIVSKDGTLQLDVSSGRYYFGTHMYQPTGGLQISWDAFYRNGSGNYTVVSQNFIDYQHYDNGSGTLAVIPDSNYARHSLYVVNDGAIEQYLFVYGQTTYSTLLDAENGDVPPQPSTWTGNMVLIASIIVKNTITLADQISEIRDERPRVGFRASGVSVVTNHGDLIGLLHDDHPQYILTNGGRVLTGDLNLGGNDIINVDGVDAVALAPLYLGYSNATSVDIGRAAATVSLTGSTISLDGTTNISGKMITINKHGLLNSAFNSGIQLEENNVITGYIETDASRNNWEFKAPNTDGVVIITPGASGFTIDQGSHDPVTLLSTTTGLSLVNQVLSLAEANGSTTGALSSENWTLFYGKQDGNPKLTALAGIGADGIIAYTGSNTFSSRTITGTANQVIVANGDGLSGNPTLSLPQNIHTGATPTFAGLNISGSGTIVPGTGGVDVATLNLGTSAAMTITLGNTSAALALKSSSATTVTGPGMTLLSGGALGLNNGTYTVSMKAPTTGMSADYDFVLPPTGGTSGYVLATNGSGTTSWVAQSSGGAVLLGGNSSVGTVTLGTNDANPVNIETSGKNRIMVDANGNTVYSTKYRASAYRSTNQTLPTPGAVVLFNTITDNPSAPLSGYSSATGRFTAPYTGFYLVTTNVTVDPNSSSSNRSLLIRKNGVAIPGCTSYMYMSGEGEGTPYYTLSYTGIVYLSTVTSDYIDVYVASANNSDAVVANSSGFSVQYLSFTPA